MEHVVIRKGARFHELGQSVDRIGWRRFMEGMVSNEVVTLQAEFVALGNCSLSLNGWTKGLVVKLLETTHGQWLYRNVQVHDTVSGWKAAERKENLQREIERQIEMGGEGLEDQDRYLLDINLDDLETSSGEDQYYWLVAICAAREDRELKEQQANTSSRKRGRKRRHKNTSH